jgi:hypothetical protein
VSGGRACGGCGCSFEPANPRAAYCSSPCRQLAHRRRAKGDAAAQLAALVWNLRRRGQIGGLDALELLISPPAEALELLEAVA